MAIHNDPMMYRGGAVVFNNQPAVNLYAQTLARKQAREESLDEYERNRMNRINEAGLRDQDREGFDNGILDLKTYYNAHKKSIGQGNTPEAYNYEKMFRDRLAYVSESKDLNARAEAFNKLIPERLKMGRNTPQDWIDDFAAHELPIGSEGHKTLDMTKYMSQRNPKYDQAKSIKMYAGITKMPTTPRYEDIPGRPDLKNEIVEYKFDKAGRDAIRARAEDEFDNDDAFLNLVQSKVNNTVEAARLEKVFEDNFGTKPRNMKDYAVASKMDELQQTLRTEKRVNDWPYKNALTDRQKKESISLNKTASPDEVYDIYETVKADMDRRHSQKEEWLEVGQLSNPTAVERIVAQAQLKNKSYKLDKLRLIEGDDGSFKIFTKPEQDGKTDFIGYVDKTALNLPKQPTARQKTAVIVEGNPALKNQPKRKDSLGIRDK